MLDGTMYLSSHWATASARLRLYKRRESASKCASTPADPKLAVALAYPLKLLKTPLSEKLNPQLDVVGPSQTALAASLRTWVNVDIVAAPMPFYPCYEIQYSRSCQLIHDLLLEVITLLCEPPRGLPKRMAKRVYLPTEYSPLQSTT